MPTPNHLTRVGALALARMLAARGVTPPAVLQPPEEKP